MQFPKGLIFQVFPFTFSHIPHANEEKHTILLENHVLLYVHTSSKGVMDALSPP